MNNDHPFRQGEIYKTKDLNVDIPDNTPRALHVFRPVVILYDSPDNVNPLVPRVMIAPLSHRVDLKKVCDLELASSTDGVKQDSLLRLDLVQPILKTDLEGPVGVEGPLGVLSESAIDRMTALMLFLLGVSMEEENQDEDLEEAGATEEED